MESLLKKYFGYDAFRPMQLEIINNVLQKKDSLVLMHTGGGKSLCYQIPALKFEGLTIVVSPLISLMKDQVDNLQANGVGAEYINSTLSSNEIENIKGKIVAGETKLIYIAPERLALGKFKAFLQTLNISLIAIDEAHCISAWGHDFRKEYRNLKFLKVLFPGVPIIALTATATMKVREDILKQLSLVNPQTFISSFDRKNLTLMVMQKKNTFNKILSLIKKHKNESVIIYCFSRKDTESIAQRLNENGYDARPYHAGLSHGVRKKHQDLFIQDKVKIIVATIAFGMGIDKPDVRLIIHHTFSKSLEGYYQEIGRAGRDGIASDCVLFYTRGDRRKHGYFVDKITNEMIRNSTMDKLSKMMAYCEGKKCRRKGILSYFGETFSCTNCEGCDVCLGLREIEGSVEDQCVVSEKVKSDKRVGYDKTLFEKLRALRKRIAGERRVPPYIIFGDVSLREMSTTFPKDKGEFLRINGVGQKKLHDLGDLFLQVIRNHVGGDEIVHRNLGWLKRRARHLSKSYQKTKELLLKKSSIEEIARIQGVKEGRVIYHIEKLIEGGEKIDVNYLISSKENFEIIKSAFEKIGLDRLAPIYNYFDEKYSYEEIRLVRIIMAPKNTPKGNMGANYHERVGQIKKEHADAYDLWTPEADEIITMMYRSGRSHVELSEILGRTTGAIKSRLRKLGLM